MKSRIDWEKETFDVKTILERAAVLCLNRLEEAAEKRPEFNKGTMQYCEVGPHFDQECQTLINLLTARRELTKTFGPK